MDEINEHDSFLVREMMARVCEDVKKIQHALHGPIDREYMLDAEISKYYLQIKKVYNAIEHLSFQRECVEEIRKAARKEMRYALPYDVSIEKIMIAIELGQSKDTQAIRITLALSEKGKCLADRYYYTYADTLLSSFEKELHSVAYYRNSEGILCSRGGGYCMLRIPSLVTKEEWQAMVASKGIPSRLVNVPTYANIDRFIF